MSAIGVGFSVFMLFYVWLILGVRTCLEFECEHTSDVILEAFANVLSPLMLSCQVLVAVVAYFVGSWFIEGVLLA
jgi:hypothetical protein